MSSQTYIDIVFRLLYIFGETRVDYRMITTERTKNAAFKTLKAAVNEYIVKSFTKNTVMDKSTGIHK